VRDALADPDPLGQLRRQVAGAADIYLRAAPLLDVVRSAATTDPDLAEVWATNLQQRLTVLRVFAEALTRKTALRDELTAEAAADIALALLSPETYNLLVNDRGWTHRRWQDWAADVLVDRRLQHVRTAREAVLQLEELEQSANPNRGPLVCIDMGTGRADPSGGP
jgi:hypothetical protein